MSSTASPDANRTKQCPYCAESIRYEAVRCRFCGSDLRPRRRVALATVGPAVGAVSGLVGAVGGVVELLTIVDVLDRDDSGSAPFFPDSVESATSTGTHVAVLVAALVVGLVGLGAGVLARRRPKAASLTLVGGAAAAVGVALLVRASYALVALAVACAVGAAAIQLVSRSRPEAPA